MSLDEIERLIRRYLSAGVAVAVVLVVPAQNDDTAASAGRPVATAAPTASGAAAPARGGSRDRADDPDGSGAGGPSTTGSTRPGGSAASGGSGSNGTGSNGDASSGDTDTTGSGSGSGTGTDSGDAGTGSTGALGSDPDSHSTSPTSTPRTPSSSSPPSSSPSSPAPSAQVPTAAERYGWGTPSREDDFTTGSGLWKVYDGPAHAGEGTRAASALSLRNGVLTITGDTAGTTGGIAWTPGQKYGRWEARVRAPVADPSFDAVLLLWPDAEDSPAGGEIDLMELQDPARRSADAFVHHGAADALLRGQVQVDATQWHTWAVEWSPQAITTYLDGKQWFRTTDTSAFPPGPMHLCIQLDWFPQGSAAPKASSMQVDWVRQYALPRTTTRAPATSTTPSPEPAAGESPIRRMFSWS